MSKAEKKECTYPGASVTSKLLFYFLIFLIMMLLVVWVFQVMLLNVFYRNTKMNEMERISETIQESIAMGNLQPGSHVISRAEEYLICIRVFRVLPDDRMEQLWDADVNDECFLHNVPEGKVLSLYHKALAEDGHLQTVFQRSGRHPALEMESGQEPSHVGNRIFTEQLSMVSVDVCYAGEEQTPYVIMVNSALTPLSATVATLRVQFVWIAMILVGLALLMAMVFARSIVSPIVRMNQTAKQLAKGNYDVHFEGEGYLETRELADTLNYASKELSKNDRLQKELIANVSHDLRTPLTAILGYSELLETETLSAEGQERLARLLQKAGYMSELLESLFELTKVSSGAIEAKREEIDLIRLLEQTIGLFDDQLAMEGMVTYKVRTAFSRNRFRKSSLQTKVPVNSVS